MSNEQGKRYWVPKHVYCCMTSEGAVFLDLRRDRYFGLGQKYVCGLESVICGWARGDSPVDATHRICSEDLARRANFLVAQGLLTTDPLLGKPLALTCRDDLPAIEVGLADDDVAKSIGLREVANYAGALIGAYWSLQTRRLESVIAEVAARRRQAASRRGAPDMARLVELVSAFRKLRSFTFSTKRRCLLHSLALINFLAQYNVFPTWVIGVESSPFSAHSWVQMEAIALDATPEEVRFFTPILAV